RALHYAVPLFPTRRSSDLSVIGAGMYDAAVATALVTRDIALLLEKHHGFVRKGLLQLASGGDTDDAAADNDEVIHRLRRACRLQERKSTRLNSSHVKMSYA